MNIKSLAAWAVALLASCSLALTAQAGVEFGLVGGGGAIGVGANNISLPNDPVDPDAPGIGHKSLANGARVKFTHLQNLGNTTGTGAGDPDSWKLTHITPPELPPGVPPHTGIGYFNFVQAGTESVFFGEWSQNEQNNTDPTHAVYYAGQAGDVAATLPTGSDVTYSIKSVNNAYTAATAADLPNSTLTANFGTLEASSLGDISFEFGGISVDADKVALLADNVSVNSVNGTGGSLEGDFFGTGAAAVAGLVIFADDASKNTAFGGTKNP